MEEEKYQKELFEFEEPKKSFSRLTDMLPKADFEGRVAITLTLEKMVFIFIGVVMLMVIIYALGVESGKSRPAVGAQATRQIAPPPVTTVLQTRVTTMAAKNMLNTAPVVPASKPAPVVMKTEAPGAAAKPYTILAGSYKKREGAQASAVMLSRQGLNVIITYSEPYYRVCVGAYTSKTSVEAQKDLIAVKRIYKDAMIKLK